MKIPPPAMEDAYSRESERFIRQYEKITPDQTYAPWKRRIPKAPCRILDVGAGSGRDAAWFAAMGHEVTAVEPSDAMREAARRLHPSPSIQWIKDALPSLDALCGNKQSFDLILLNAVWLHVRPRDREKALAALCSLMDAKALLVITLRHGPVSGERKMHPCSGGELVLLAKAAGLRVIESISLPDALGRAEISWTHVLLGKEAVPCWK